MWCRYIRTRSDADRNALMEIYLCCVRYQAERIKARLPDEVQVDDLVSAGVFGLMDAIAAFDLGRGIKFETYCAPRVRGAILDELREMDWVPRLVRSRSAKVEQASKQLEMESGRTPTAPEVAERLQVPMEEYEKISKDANAVGVVSLSRKWFETDSNKEIREIDVLKDKQSDDSFKEVDNRDLKTLILKGLNRAERLIVILYYYEEMTMREIGATLDLSESRVSQMHSSVLARLRAQMTPAMIEQMKGTRGFTPARTAARVLHG